MVDESKPDAKIPTADSPTGATPMPPSGSTKKSPATKPASPIVRVEGLAETLHEVRHELNLLSTAHRYNWINQRLILLRNFIIAMSVSIGVIVVVVLCYREATRQTLSISAFDVPEKLSERGITGQVVAKALFDELITTSTIVGTAITALGVSLVVRASKPKQPKPLK